MRAMRVVVVMFLMMMGCMASTVWSADSEKKATGQNALDLSVQKLGRGIYNVLFSEMELLQNVAQETADDGIPSGLTIGVVRGIQKTLTRAIVGTYEISTFTVPQGPILKPEFFTAEAVEEQAKKK